MSEADLRLARAIYGVDGDAWEVEAIAQTLANVRAEGYRQGVEAAAEVAEEWRAHHAESVAKGKYTELHMEKEIASKCIRDEIRALAETGGKE